MSPVGFEPTVSAGERPQTYALDRAATGTGNRNEYQEYFLRAKGDRRGGQKTLLPSCVDCHEVWEPHSPGNLTACPQGLLYTLLLPSRDTASNERRCTSISPRDFIAYSGTKL